MDFLRKADLPSKWANALCEDTMIYRHVSRLGKQIVFVPSVFMANNESTRISSFFGWSHRQLLVAVLYHPSWAWLTLIAMALFSGLTISLSALVVGVWRGAAFPVVLSVTGLTAHSTSLIVLLLWLDRTVARLQAERGESLPTSGGWAHVAMIPLAISVNLVLYAGSWLRVIFARRVHWRGINYQLGFWALSTREVRRLNYQVFAQPPSPAVAQAPVESL